MYYDKLGNKADKYLSPKVKFANLITSVNDYLCLNGFKINEKKELTSIFDNQIRSGLSRITIKKSFYGGNKK